MAGNSFSFSTNPVSTSLRTVSISGFVQQNSHLKGQDTRFNTAKMMMTITWHSLGDWLPKDPTFHAEHHRNNNLSALLPLRPHADGRKLMIHEDNANRHKLSKCTTFCSEHARRPAAHPPYSPDLAGTDFFLFGHVKDCLKGTIFQSREELVEAIREKVAAIPPGNLHGVFGHWMKRLEWVSQNNSDEYP
jgi:hypothetical protein